jgi:hypothetical protein
MIKRGYRFSWATIFLLSIFAFLITPISGAYALDTPSGLVASGNRSGSYSQGSVTLTWAPVIGATGYAIQTLLNGSVVGDSTGVLGQSSNNLVVSGLQGGTTYSFKIRAVSDSALSPWSTSVSASAITSPSTPAKPTYNVSLLDITVRWTAPASDGGTGINSYLVTEVNSGRTQSVSSSNFSAQFNGFAGGSKVKFNVSAINGVTAEGSISANSDETTLSNVPNQVTGVLISKTSNKDELQVSWDPAGNGGTTLTGYEVYLRQNGRDVQSLQITDISVGTSIFAGLAAGSYSAQVLAKNIIGSGMRSAEPTPIAVDGVTPATISGGTPRTNSATSLIPKDKLPTQSVPEGNRNPVQKITKSFTLTAIGPSLAKVEIASSKIVDTRGKILKGAKITISKKGKVQISFPEGSSPGLYLVKILGKNKKNYRLKVEIPKK